MTLNDIMEELKSMGSEQTKKTLLRHGACEPLFGVKVADMKMIVKKVKKNHELSLALFDTGNSDARYLAGLLADEKKVGINDLNHWVENANWYMLSEYTVPWIAAESRFGFELGKQWIQSDAEHIASAGWSCLASLATIQENEQLDLGFFEACLDRIGETLHLQTIRVRYTMNGFVIAVGSSIPSLTEKAKAIAKKIGKVEFHLDGTACKLPDALSYIEKIEGMGRIGKKKKMARC